MLAQWTWPAYVAVLLGTILFTVAFTPLLIVQSRRFGRLTWRRTLADVMLSIYLTALVAYTLLPFPPMDYCLDRESVQPMLRPFHSINDILEAGTARTTAVLQVVFNVVLFVPLGAFLRRHIGTSISLAITIGFGISLLVEITQGTGIFGLYDCAYRVADVDDLITNTTGGVVGAFLAPVLLGWLPSPHVEKARRGEARPITRTRRLIGMVIDFGLLFLTTGVFIVTYRAIAHYGFGQEFTAIDASWWQWAIGPATWLVLFLAPMIDGSATPGQKAVWLKPDPNMPRARSRLQRFLGGLGVWVLLSSIAAAPPLASTPSAEFMDALATTWLILCGLAVVFDKQARGLSLRFANMTWQDSRT